MSDNVDIMLSIGESFISSTGKKFVKGEIYTVPKEEAIKLMGIKGDFDLRFFKKSDGAGVKAKAVDVETQDVHPSPKAIAESSNAENLKAAEAAKAMDKADAIATATRGQGDAAIEAQLAQKQRIATAGMTPETGELDTASDLRARARARTANAIPV